MAQRIYATIECWLFKDTRFLELAWPEKLTWLYLLGNSSRVRCPGLVEGSVITVAQYLRWPLKVGDSERFHEAIKESEACIKKLVQMGWVEHDLRAGLFYLPNAISHNPPDNTNILWSWCRNLKEFPSSPLTRRWLKDALETLTTLYGRQDSRQRLVAQICKSLSTRGTLDVAQYGTKVPGFYDGYPPGTSDGIASCLSTIRLASAQSRTSNGDEPAKKDQKTQTPAPDFTERQRELWSRFLSEKFWVPGRGDQTVWENVKDPANLCRKLGGDGFMDVDLDIIYRLAAWSYEKKGKARRNLGAFLRACFARDQSQLKGQVKMPEPKSFKAFEIPSDHRPDEEQRARAIRDSGISLAVDEVDDE